MAVPAIVVKVIATASTSKKGRNVLAVLIAAILMPIIIVILMICALISGTENANQNLLDYSFKGVSISQDFTDEQREAIENMREWLAELDTTIAKNDEEYSLDGDMVRAVFYCLQFGTEIAADFDYDSFCKCFDGLIMEQLDEALQNISEQFPQYSITENQKTAIQNTIDFDPQLEQLILKLQSQLKNSKGKKVYGYLQPNVKKTVDNIVAVLAQNSVLKKMYEQWCELERQKYETYTSAVPKLPPLEENKIFKPIKNAVIRAVLEMDILKPTMKSETFSDDEKESSHENLDGEENDDIVDEKGNMNQSGDYKSTDEIFSDNKTAKTFSEGTDKYNQTAMRNAVMSMLFSFGRLISYNYNRSLRQQNMRTEHKLKSAIRRKKQTLGLKESLTEQKF